MPTSHSGCSVRGVCRRTLGPQPRARMPGVRGHLRVFPAENYFAVSGFILFLLSMCLILTCLSSFMVSSHNSAPTVGIKVEDVTSLKYNILNFLQEPTLEKLMGWYMKILFSCLLNISCNICYLPEEGHKVLSWGGASSAVLFFCVTFVFVKLGACVLKTEGTFLEI